METGSLWKIVSLDKGVQKGVYASLAFGPWKVERNTMKVTNTDKQVGDPDGFDEGTYRLALCNECFATSHKVVRPKPDDRALAAGAAQ